MGTCHQCGRWSAHRDNLGQCRICQVPGTNGVAVNTNDVLARMVGEWSKADVHDQAMADELESRAIVGWHTTHDLRAWD